MLPVAVPETAKDMTTSLVGLLLPLTRLIVIGVPKLPSLIVEGLAMRSNVATEWGMINQVLKLVEISANDSLDSITMASIHNRQQGMNNDDGGMQFINSQVRSNF